MKQLFKYLPEPRNIFEEGFIRLSQPVALNDPFEGAFCNQNLDELASYFDDNQAHDYVYGDIPFSEYIKLKMHHIGVISLSENKENLLMWAHYANEHKGVVAGVVYKPEVGSIFENLFRADTYINSSFGEEFSPFNGKPKPVSYRKGLRYRNDKFDFDYSNIDAEGADRLLYEVFMQKSDEWIYEQEHSVVLRLEQSDRVIVEDINQIENKNIKKLITAAPDLHPNESNSNFVINLYKIDDPALRTAIAIELTKLSKNPKTIYLMRLNASCINNCLLGLNCLLDKNDVRGKYATSIGYLDIWKAIKNNEHYCLDFVQIYKS